MSNNIKDRIVFILNDIVASSKDEHLLLGDLQELLLELKEISVFDGIELFISYINNKTPIESQTIELFLYRFLEDLTMFPKLYNHIARKSPELKPLLAKQQMQEKETSTSSLATEKPVDLAGIAEEIEESKAEDENTPLFDDMSGAGGKSDMDQRLDDLYDDSIIANKNNTPEVKSKPKPSPPPSPAPAARSRSEPMPPPPSQAAAPGGPPMAPPRMEKSMPKEQSQQKKKKSRSASISDAKITMEESVDESAFVETGKRGVLVDYFSRMNINQVYEFSVKIDKEMLKARKKQSDVLTGEQREQLSDEISVVEDRPIEIELQMPGCMVSPSIHYISPNPKTTQVTFYVTPYVKFSKKMGRLVIGQDKLGKKTINFNVSVIDRRIMKIFSLVGILIAGIPSVWPYFFGYDMNAKLTSDLSYYLSFVTQSTIVPLEIGLGAVITGLSLLIFKLYSSKRANFTSSQAL